MQKFFNQYLGITQLALLGFAYRFLYVQSADATITTFVLSCLAHLAGLFVLHEIFSKLFPTDNHNRRIHQLIFLFTGVMMKMLPLMTL